MNPYFVTTFLSDIFIYHTLPLFLSIEVDSRTDGSGTGFTYRSFFLIYKGNNKHFLKGLYKSLHLPTRAHWDSCKNVLPSSLKYLNRSPLQALNWAKVSRVTSPPYVLFSPFMCLHLILVLGLLTFWKTSGSAHLIQMQPQTRRHLRCGGGWILNFASTFSPILALHNTSISVCAIKH